MGGFSLGGGKSKSDVRVFQGVYPGMGERREFGDLIKDYLNRVPKMRDPLNFAPATSSFRDPYRSAVLDRFTPTTAETDVLNQVSDRTAAGFAARGLGATPIAASSTAASIAPTLVGLRQAQIENLRSALGGDVAEADALNRLTQTQRSGDMTTELEQYRTRLAGLMQFFEQAFLPRALGQTSSSRNLSLSATAGTASPGRE